MDIHVVNEFLSYVYKYYPVGFMHCRDLYPGNQEIDKIVVNKMNESEVAGNQHSHFADALKASMGLLTVRDNSGAHFPNYVFSVSLLPKKEGKIVNHARFEICVSLLCDYYTYYLVDDFRLEGYYQEKLTTSFMVFSCEQSNDRIHEFIAPAVDNMNKFFPNKKYIPYGFLNDHAVYGTICYDRAVGEIYDPGERHTFFELLFSTAYNWSQSQKSMK